MRLSKQQIIRTIFLFQTSQKYYCFKEFKNTWVWRRKEQRDKQSIKNTNIKAKSKIRSSSSINWGLEKTQEKTIRQSTNSNISNEMEGKRKSQIQQDPTTKQTKNQHKTLKLNKLKQIYSKKKTKAKSSLPWFCKPSQAKTP